MTRSRRNVPAGRGGSLRRGLAAIAATAVCLGMHIATAAEPPSLEYQVKASYVYNFLKFVDWPPQAITDDVLLVCLIGRDRFGRALDTLSGEAVRALTVAVRRTLDPAALEGCQAVFISATSPEIETQILGQLAGRPVLTIGESRGFIERGGVINLVRVNDTIRFEINQPAAAAADLRISSQLLQLAVRK